MWLINILPEWVFHLSVIISIIALLILPLISFIPIVRLHKTLITYFFIALLGFGVYMEGSISNNNVWKAKVAELELKNSQLETKAAEKTVQIVTETIYKVEKVKGDTIEIIKKVPVYITKENDDNCVIPESFDQLHDFAAKNIVPETSGVSNAGTGETDLSGDKEGM